MSALTINILKVMLFAALMLLIMTDLNGPARADYQRAATADAQKSVDTNHSGMIEKVKISPAFTKLDRDHDGKISRREAVNEPSLSLAFARADSNHDGMIAIDELTDFAKATPLASN